MMYISVRYIWVDGLSQQDILLRSVHWYVRLYTPTVFSLMLLQNENIKTLILKLLSVWHYLEIHKLKYLSWIIYQTGNTLCPFVLVNMSTKGKKRKYQQRAAYADKQIKYCYAFIVVYSKWIFWKFLLIFFFF